ncbi:hypothetical protein CAEBREN_18538 [Caenorhabditis brenneri]|uniref:Domain of unknown function WSN domain-containing protein n=1 Tax=Caenorhabditis brenneri TaxID=135651 RepID=G0MIV9_CAEBE|nr:hypothetical protein CAEBREN_18538 [Caenorhabditis brenneri]
MWFLKLFVLLLLKTPFIQSNESKFSIKELHHELRGVPEAANNLFLESQVLNGDVSVMDLMGKLFDGKLDVELFKKYRKIDYANGIDEQIKMLELSEKAEKVKVTEEVRKSVRDGLETLESMKDPIPGFEEDLEVMAHGIDDVWNITDKMARLRNERYRAVDEPTDDLGLVVGRMDELVKMPFYARKNWEMKNLEARMFRLKKSNQLAAHYLYDYGIMDEIPSLDYLRKFERFINEEKKNLKKTRELEDVIPKFPLIIDETKIMAELRDSQLAKRIPEMMKELEDDTNSIIEIEMSESVASKYHAIKSLSGIMEDISELNSQLHKAQRKSPYLLKSSKQVFSHLNNLNFPSESSFGSFKRLETCLTQYDFTQAADFENKVKEFENLRGTIETSYEKFRQLVKEFRDLYNVVLYFEKLDFSREFENMASKDLNEVLKKTVHMVDKDMLDRARKLKEEVTAISEGFGVLETIRKVQDHWDTIATFETSEFDDSNAKDGWDSIIGSLKTFTEEMSTFETNSEFPELKNFQVDSVVDFIKTAYRGRQKRNILKILEDLGTFQVGYPEYSSKMAKMNKALAKFKYIQKVNKSIEKFNKWDTEGEQIFREEDSKKDQLVTDCYEDHSDFCYRRLQFSDANPEDSVKEVGQ